MKKSLSLFFAVVMCFTNSFSQESDRAVSEGDNVVNVFYGVNLVTGFYKNLASTTASEVKVKGIGPVGLVYEHLLTDGIGLGAEFSYASTLLTYVDRNTDPNTGIITNYNWEFKFATIRAMFRANFHFAKSEKFDAYFFMSAGYRGTSFTVKSTDPTFKPEDYKLPKVLPPYGFKPGFGFRYFFTDNFGINSEIAIGTPVMSAGVSVKF